VNRHLLCAGVTLSQMMESRYNCGFNEEYFSGYRTKFFNVILECLGDIQLARSYIWKCNLMHKNKKV
jgi:hypothetical protein